MARIVETDNFNGDYPGESFLNLPPMSEEMAEKVCAVINDCCSGENRPRFWKVVPETYKLQPGFEP